MTMEHAMKFNRRMEVPGFKKLFKQKFMEAARKHPQGTVDDEAVAQQVLKELGVKDPVNAEKTCS